MFNLLPKELENRFVIRTIFATSPAAGADYFVTVPANKTWIPLSLYLELAAAVGGPNRVLYAGYFRSAARMLVFRALPTQAPNSASGYSFSNNNVPIFEIATDAVGTLPLFRLSAGDVFRTLVLGLQAADQISAIALTIIEADTRKGI